MSEAGSGATSESGIQASRALSDQEKWLISAFLAEREKERDKQHQRWTRTAGIAAAVLAGVVSAGAWAFFNNVQTAAVSAAERAVREGGLRQQVEQNQIEALRAAADAKAATTTATGEVAALRVATQQGSTTVQALGEQVRTALTEINNSRSLIEAVRLSAGSTDAVAKALLQDQNFRTNVIDRLAIPSGTIAFFALEQCPAEAG
jgi:predicted negative regulator of RcsB-dependent stress response